MISNLFFLFFSSSFLGFSQEKHVETIRHTYVVDSIYSNNTKDYRTIKIFLPEEYSEKETYPVIYTLDGEWMFEPTAAASKTLMNFDVIPKSIVVGVFHKNRDDDLGIQWKSGSFSDNSQLFFKFLTQELVPSINNRYKTSGFNVLVGHSNGATFTHNTLLETNQPFRGIVALSQNLFGTQLQEYHQFTEQSFASPLFYFIASGKRDATPRLESGMKLDSLFRINQNSNLKLQHVLYDADHNGIAAKGINNGLSHIFSEYKHYNDWDEQLINSLVAKKVRSIDFMKQHIAKMKRIYGVDFKPNRDDLSLMQSMTQNEADIQEVQDYDIKHFGKTDHFYATYAQFYEYAKLYDKALEYWKIHLNNNHKNNLNFFYYRRPIDLLYKKMKEPKKAIEFAKKWKKKVPDFASSFNAWIAKITRESNN